MIKKSLISLMYEAASIQRWNDHIRPWTGFTELDKQAHKMFYAYVLAKCEGESVNMIKLIEGVKHCPLCRVQISTAWCG